MDRSEEMRCSNALLIFASCILCSSCGISFNPFHEEGVQKHLSDYELDEIRLYAEQFRFKVHSDGDIVYSENPSPLVQEAINRSAEINEKRHLPYAALYVLRLYQENMRRHPNDYQRTTLSNSNIRQRKRDLEYEFARIAMPPRSRKDYYDIHIGYDWIKKHKSRFSHYQSISEELNKIEQLKEKLERQKQEIAAQFGLKKLERFAIETPVIPNGWAPEAVPEEINRILEKLRDHDRTQHLPYLLEYGLNLYLKNLTLSHLARVLPVDDNLMLSELVRLTGIPKYSTAHEAGWLNRQFYGSFKDIDDATGYSSYQIYIWYLENWSSVLDMPNFDRLCDIQNQIEKTGMHGVGGGLVCHYGCR
jgi:hypothetical protein